MDTESPVVWPAWCYSGDTTSSENTIETQNTTTKSSRRRRLDRSNNNNSSNNNGQMPDFTLNNNNNNNNTNNNNNHVKNERLSPGTPDNSSGSRSVTPSSASHPDTPPAPENNPMLSLPGRNYSDFMRSLAAKYNNTNTNDYFGAVRNGFPPPLDPRFKPTGFANIIPNLPTTSKDDNNKKPDFSAILHPFATNAILPPLIDMSSTQALLAMMRTAKESELQGLLKNVKRQDTASPLDLSAAAPPAKRARTKTPSGSSNMNNNLTNHKRDQSESPRLQEDISNWTVDDVCNFVSSIDICAEYAQNFREQRIDGAGLPLLTEEHLTTTINMKLGPALKLKSILAKKLGSYNLCFLCSNCHNTSTSPDHANTTGNNSDSGGVS